MNVKAKTAAVVKKINDNTSFQYRVFVIVFCVLTLLFCTSKLYLPSASNITPTAYGSSQKASSSTTLTLDSYKYNPDSRYMELIASINNTSDNFHLQFEAFAAASSDRTHKLDSKIEYSSQQILVVSVSNIKNFDGVKISITETTENSANVKSNSAEFVCSKNSVEKDSSLDSKSQNQYQQIDMQISIQNMDRQIQSLQSENDKLQSQIGEYQQDIDVLEAQKKYQTEDEIKKTSDSQKSKTMQINRVKTQIQNNQKQQDSYRQKQEKYKQQLSDLQKNST